MSLMIQSCQAADFADEKNSEAILRGRPFAITVTTLEEEKNLSKLLERGNCDKNCWLQEP
jgi:hypothetical protein